MSKSSTTLYVGLVVRKQPRRIGGAKFMQVHHRCAVSHAGRARPMNATPA